MINFVTFGVRFQFGSGSVQTVRFPGSVHTVPVQFLFGFTVPIRFYGSVDDR